MAIGIEELLRWAFQDERATLFDTDALDVTAGYPQDSIERARRAWILGGFVTSTSPGSRVIASNVANDAEIVAEAVMGLRPWMDANLVASYARAGARPDWKPDAEHRWSRATPGQDDERGEMVPMHERGHWKKHKITIGPGKRITAPPPRWCRVRERDAPCVVRAYREQYTRWWLLLERLAIDLEGRLERWTLTETMPPWEPWK